MKSSNSSSEFWRDLGKEFRSLQTRPGELRAERSLSFMMLDAPPSAATWSILYYSQGLQQQWETLAKRGGDALSENDFVDTLHVWLERLRAEKVNYTGEQYLYEGDDTSCPRIEESITDLADASSILCGLLESAALDHERHARAVKHQRKANQQHVESSETVVLPSGVPEVALPSQSSSPENERRRVVEPLLREKGWSVLEWAAAAHVAHATAMDYLDLKTKPYPSTRTKLAKALDISVDQLPH